MAANKYSAANAVSNEEKAEIYRNKKQNEKKALLIKMGQIEAAMELMEVKPTSIQLLTNALINEKKAEIYRNKKQNEKKVLLIKTTAPMVFSPSSLQSPLAEVHMRPLLVPY